MTISPEARLRGAAGEWLRTADVTALLGVTPATVRRWAAAGHFVTRTTPGGHRRFERSSLLAFAEELLATGESRSGAAPPASGAGGPDGTDAARPGYHGLWIESQRLSIALAATVHDGGRDPAAAREAEDAAARFGSTAASRGMTADVLVAAFVAIRDPLLHAVSARACSGGLGRADAAEVLVSAVSQLDRLLQRALLAHRAFSASR